MNTQACVTVGRLRVGHWATLGAFAYALATTALSGFRKEPWLCAVLCALLLTLGGPVAELFDRIVPYLVFLDHHYLVDGLCGFLLAGVSVFVVSRISAWPSSVGLETAEEGPRMR